MNFIIYVIKVCYLYSAVFIKLEKQLNLIEMAKHIQNLNSCYFISSCFMKKLLFADEGSRSLLNSRKLINWFDFKVSEIFNENEDHKETCSSNTWLILPNKTYLTKSINLINFHGSLNSLVSLEAVYIMIGMKHKKPEMKNTFARACNFFSFI